MRLLISGSWVRAPRWATSFCRVHSKDLATDGNVFRKHFNPIRPQGVLFTIPLSRSTASLLRQFNICWFLKLKIFISQEILRNGVIKRESSKVQALFKFCTQVARIVDFYHFLVTFESCLFSTQSSGCCERVNCQLCCNLHRLRQSISQIW